MRLIQRDLTNLKNTQPLPGIMPPVTVRQFRGVNTYDPFSIDETYWMDMSNMTTDDFPAASTRPGFSVLGNTSGKVIGLMVWKAKELHAIFSDGTWRKWTGSTWTTLASGLNTSARWYWTNFEGSFNDINLIASNGVDPIKRYDGSVVSNLSGAPAGGNFITTYSNRLWCAVGKEVHACALDQPTVWNDFSGDESDSYVKTMESTAGENVNMLSGGLYRLTIGMPSSLHLLFGNMPSDFNTRLITDDTGVTSNSGVVTQDGTMWLMHKTGIYTYSASTIPDKTASDIVKRYYPSITEQSTAGTDGTKLYFNLQNGKSLVFDPRVNAWSVWDMPNAEHYVEIDNVLYIGDASGRVLKLGGAASDNGASISWYAVTRPMTNGSVAQTTRWLKMFVHLELAVGSTLNIYLSDSKDGNDWDLVYSTTGTGEKIDRIMVPIGKFVLSNMVRIKIEGTGPAKFYEHTRQVRQMPLY